MAWSAGSTLVVLLVLGVAIYAAAATSLAGAGTAQLRARLAEMTSATVGPVVIGPGGPAMGPMLSVTSDPAQPGFVLGGATSGTIGFVVSGAAAGATSPGTGAGSLDEGTPPAGAVGSGAISGGDVPVTSPGLVALGEGVRAAVAGGQAVVVETTIGDAPVRVLAAPVPSAGGSVMALVIGDRSAEVDTLRTLLAVLLVGGVAVLAASVAFGYLYAGRALVPIRESLRRQREFAADASHELRTPLAINRAAIAELRRGRDDPATVDRALDDLEAGNARLELLVDDLLLLARTDAEAVELVVADTDLALAAAEASESLEAVAAAAGVRLVLDLEPVPVRGDEARLRQLVGILVANGIAHAPTGGRVTITVRPGATVIVDDDGPGIAPEHLDRVFERFWRAPGAPAGGTGLGLPIARWIAERHGGSIHAENRVPGPGARFVATVPGS
jgi:signal transduction histidine kinase